MRLKISSAVLAAKVALLACGIGWAVFVSRWAEALGEISSYLAKTTHTTVVTGSGLSYALAEVQIYALAFGPAALALALLLIRWPARGGPATDERQAAR